MFASQIFYELKGEVPLKPQYQEKQCIPMIFHSQVNLIFVGWNVIVKSTNL